jgi:hypothetical protein
MTDLNMDSLDRNAAPAWSQLLMFGLLTRVAVFGVGLVMQPTQPPLSGIPSSAEESSLIRTGSLPVLEPWYRFDACWYSYISRVGYTSISDKQEPSLAFMPLLPICMAVASQMGIDRYIAGLIIPNVAFVVGLACFGRLSYQLTGSRSKSWWACILLTTFPYSLFFSLPYQESLFFAASTASALAWTNNRLVLAGLFSGLASLSRLTAAAFPVAVLAQVSWAWHRGQPVPRLFFLPILGSAVGITIFFGYLWWNTGNPFAHLKAHEMWGRKPASVEGLLQTATTAVDTWSAWFKADVRKRPMDTMITLLIIGCFGFGARAWHKWGPFWGLMIIIPPLQAISTGSILSFQRISLCSYPIAIVIADLSFMRYIRWPWLVGGSVAQFWLLNTYFNDTWVG